MSEVPSGWEVVSLFDIVLDPKRDLVDGPFGSSLKSSEYIDSGVPVFKIQNIKANKFVDKKISYISQAKAKELSRHSFSSGDLIITKLGNPLGLCCKVPEKYSYGIIVADLMRLRPASIIINNNYLIYLINSQVVQHQFQNITKGTTRSRVNLSIVRDIKIPLPSLSEQYRIVTKIEELFSKLDKSIESLKTAQEQLKIYRQAVLKWAFEGKLTKEWRNINSDFSVAKEIISQVAEERSLYCQKNRIRDHKTISFDISEIDSLPTLPVGWEWVKIDLLSEYNKNSIKAGPFGSSLKKENYVETGYKIYGQEQVISADAFCGDYFIDEEKYNELSSCSIKPDDILISLVGTIGKVLVLPKKAIKGIINPRLIKISLNQKIYSPLFFKYYFESSFLKAIYKQKAHGATMDVLNLGIIKDLPFPLCSVDEQKQIILKIESRLSVCDKLEESITQSLQQAEALRQSILKKAFEGKLVPQDPNDEPASILLERIRKEREADSAETLRTRVIQRIGRNAMSPVEKIKSAGFRKRGRPRKADA